MPCLLWPVPDGDVSTSLRPCHHLAGLGRQSRGPARPWPFLPTSCFLSILPCWLPSRPSPLSSPCRNLHAAGEAGRGGRVLWAHTQTRLGCKPWLPAPLWEGREPSAQWWALWGQQEPLQCPLVGQRLDNEENFLTIPHTPPRPWSCCKGNEDVQGQCPPPSTPGCCTLLAASPCHRAASWGLTGAGGALQQLRARSPAPALDTDGRRPPPGRSRAVSLGSPHPV